MTLQKIYTSFLLLFLCSALHAQTYVYNIPLDSIQLLIENSPGYIDAINKQFVTPHSKPEMVDFFDLYYGSAYTENYSPYGEQIIATGIRDLLREGKNKDVIETCNSNILQNPGFIKPFYYLGIAYENLGDTATADIFFERYYDFLSLPFYSGTGASFDSAFIVRSIADEYLILSELDLNMQSQALVFHDEKPYDILYATNDKDTTVRAIHFNIEQPFLNGFNFLQDEDKTEGNTKKEKGKKKKKK